MLNSTEAAIFRRAEAAFAADRLVDARTELDRLSPACSATSAVLHLRALVLGRLGDQGGARAAFERAIAAAPDQAEIHANFANLLDKLGEAAAALDHYDAALRIDSGLDNARFARALVLHRGGQTAKALGEIDHLLALSPNSARNHSAKGSMLRDGGRLAEAATAYDRALALEPTRPLALHGRARVALERGEAAAAAHYAAALARGVNGAEVHLGFVEALEAEGRAAEAIDHLRQLVALQPAWTEGQSVLARMRWEAGDRDGFVAELERRVSEAPGDAASWQALVAALAGADLFDQAADRARRAGQATGEASRFGLLEATYASEAGEVERAEALFGELSPALPHRALHEASHQLRGGEVERAAETLERARNEEPWSVTAWALTSVTWRLLRNERSVWLNEQPGLIDTSELELSESDLAETAATLRALHRTHSHPLGQSLRGGTQTRGRLFERTEQAVVRLKAAVERNVQRYWDELPAMDPAHPLLRHRDRRPALLGSWSVRLTAGGFHVAHFHTQGLVSSAAYFVVPEASTERDGWLEIGGAPANLGLALQPLRSIAPVPGTMALFPSYLFHGTRPFASGERITAAFDVVAK